MVNFTSLKSWLLTTALFVAGVATAQTELLQNGGSETAGESASTAIFSADFSTSLAGFTSVSASGSLEWYNDYQSAMVTGYQDFDNDGTKENQAGVTYLVSPAVDLSQVEAAYVSVNMAINYERGDINANNALLISKDYAGDANTATWTSLTYDESGLNSDFTFRSKEINIPAEFVGGSVVIAFRHTCDETFSSTWEVKSLDVISGTAEEPTEPDVPENESSRENPYSVAEAMAKYDASVAQPGVWVEGYIVGYATGSNLSSGAIFGTQAPEGGEVSATNLLIADNVDETNYENCIPVQLPAGDVRDALNLQSHPENLGKPVVLMGSLGKYFGVAGLKSVTEYVLDGETPEPEPDPSTSVFSADFSTSLDGFTSVSVSGDLEWYNDYQSAMVTGYQDFDNDGTEENQAGVTYLVSPAVDLSQVEAAYVSVNMAINYERGDINANNALLISKDYAGDANTATWTSLTYDESGLNSDFTFRSKEINIPAEFVGGSVVIAFRHTCDETFSSTWEVKSLDVISGTAEEPTEPDVPENESSRENPYSVAEAMAKYDASVAQPGVWVEGYIVGYATGSNLSSGAIFGTQAPEGGEVSATNLLIADNVDETNYENCIPVQLPAGDVRDALNLQSHPENLGKPVVLMGSLEKYFGVAGLKSVTEYVLDGEAPEPEPTSVFAKATEIVSGKRYIIVAQDDEVSHVAQNISKTSGSGYLYVTDATATNDEITTAENNAFTITEGDGGYLIQDSYGRYLYQTGTFVGFNVSAELPESGYLWTIMFDAAGQATITNVDMNKWVQYSTEHNSFGSYETPQEGGILPYLYVETDGQSIESVGADNADAPVEVYTLGGVKVGDSLNGLQKGIYIVKQGNKVQKVLK